jgi:hypothetical protein
MTRRHEIRAHEPKPSDDHSGKRKEKPGKRPGRKKKPSATPAPPQHRPSNPKPFW